MYLYTVPQKNGAQIHHPFHFEEREGRKEYLAAEREKIHDHCRFPESICVQFR